MDRSDILYSLGITLCISLGLVLLGGFLLDGMGCVGALLTIPAVFGIVLTRRISRRR